MSHSNQFAMQDPRSQYSMPKPADNNNQPDPGLDSLLEPEADHGEKTYVGCGRLKGRKALITGGDSGIGRAVAIAFSREGADVVINYLASEEQDGQDTLELLNTSGSKGYAVVGDITEEKFCQSLVSQAVEKLGSIDILVNNAGKQQFVEKLEDLSTEQFCKTYATNVFAMFWITKAAVAHMPAGASIINTTSIQSYQPSAGLLDYASSKSAITGFTKSLAKMLIDRGIRVNGVAPGPIWTPLQQSGGKITALW